MKTPRADRTLAGLGCLALLVFGVFVLWITGINSQEDHGETNELSSSLSLISAVAFLTAGVAAGVYAKKGSGLRVLVAGLVVGLAALGLWIYGMSAWCSSCGVP